MSDEEEEGHNDPGFEGPVCVREGITEDEEAYNYEEIYYRGGVAFNIKDEVERIAGRLDESIS